MEAKEPTESKEENKEEEKEGVYGRSEYAKKDFWDKRFAE